MSVSVYLDLLDQFTNTRALSLFHNRMWQSKNSEVHVHLVQHCLLVTWLVTCVTADNGFPRFIMCRFIFNVEVCAVIRWTCLGCSCFNNWLHRSIMLNSFFMKRTCFELLGTGRFSSTWLDPWVGSNNGLHRSIGSNNGLPRSIIQRFVSFPLLKRPSFVIIPLWVACWVRAFNKLFMIIVRCGLLVAADNGLPRSLLSQRSHSKDFDFHGFSSPSLLNKGWYVWWHPYNNAHHWSRFCCDRSHRSIMIWVWSWFDWELLSCCTTCPFWSLSIFWTQFSLPFMFQGDLWWRPRWHVYFFVYDFSSFHPNNFRNIRSWECFAKNESVRSCLIELQSIP